VKKEIIIRRVKKPLDGVVTGESKVDNTSKVLY